MKDGPAPGIMFLASCLDSTVACLSATVLPISRCESRSRLCLLYPIYPIPRLSWMLLALSATVSSTPFHAGSLATQELFQSKKKKKKARHLIRGSSVSPQLVNESRYSNFKCPTRPFTLFIISRYTNSVCVLVHHQPGLNQPVSLETSRDSPSSPTSKKRPRRPLGAISDMVHFLLRELSEKYIKYSRPSGTAGMADRESAGNHALGSWLCFCLIRTVRSPSPKNT